MTAHARAHILISLHGAKYLSRGGIPDALSGARTEMLLFRGPGKDGIPQSYIPKTGRTSPPVHPAFDPLLFLFTRHFCSHCLALYPLPSFFLTRNTINMLAIAMLISAAVTLVQAEFHFIFGINQ